MTEQKEMEPVDQRVYWIWLQKVFGCGSHRSNALVEKFPSASMVYSMTREQRAACRSFTELEIRRMEKIPLSDALVVFQRCVALGCQILTPEDGLYPERLRNIYAMPLVLYAKGCLQDLSQRIAITMVGTRKCTEYGVFAADLLAGQLASYGASVISGCAIGIDTASIRGAVRAHGRTVGVLGSGIDVPYPRGNERMLLWLEKHHVLVTEYPPGTPPMAQNFPQRNRIMSGLGLGTVVVEAGRKSGALITARHALEQGKDIFAVPGRINDLCSRGTLDLIRDGAKAVCSAVDILEEYVRLYPDQLRDLYEIQAERQREYQDKAAENADHEQEQPAGEKIIPPPPEDLEEQQIVVYRSLSYTPESPQVIAQRARLSVHQLLPVLTELEIMGIVCSPSASRYALASLTDAGGKDTARD